ncbi:MAG TPA: hypothetical protein VN328_01490 [Thermodesulfovibrionales bacterium]|nr:hypothetical protein [Thermodesulfovibrionales bacterium]
MPLELIDAVEDILKQVEERTGKAIQLVENKDLPMSAEMRMASKDETKHRLFHRPVCDEQINYVIANQCGHILRLFGVPEDQRFMPVANQRTMMSYVMEMGDEFHRLLKVFGQEKIKQMVRLWYEGVIFQLTKMPPDIMIDKWLYDEYPDLRPIQLSSLIRQRKEAILSLAQDTRTFTPKKIYRVSNIMNYTFFKVLEDHFRLDWVAPYHSTIFIFDGSALALLTKNDYVNNHTGDRAMIDAWAECLHLTTWYEWKPLAAS